MVGINEQYQFRRKNMATPVQGSFIDRTKKLDRPNSHTATFEVGASTTYEPTGSFKNTAFLIEAGSNYTLSLVEGGDLTAGLVTGQVYPMALKKVVNGSATIVKLIK
jgi:hypothetical protein|tara:strand:+ start:203 stop:523 length:321 start_codon:yes stop_codon:yes gene_type:complete